MKRLKQATIMLLSGNLSFAGLPATKKELAQNCLRYYLSIKGIDNDNEKIRLVAFNINHSVDEPDQNSKASFFSHKDKRNPGFIKRVNSRVDYDFKRSDTADRPQKCIPPHYPYVIVLKSIKLTRLAPTASCPFLAFCLLRFPAIIGSHPFSQESRNVQYRAFSD